MAQDGTTELGKAFTQLLLQTRRPGLKHLLLILATVVAPLENTLYPLPLLTRRKELKDFAFYSDFYFKKVSPKIETNKQK